MYTHKVHEKEAEILSGRLSRIKLGQIALSAISTGSLLTVLLGTGFWGPLVGGVFSAALLLLNLYTRNHDLGGQAQLHKDAAVNVWYVREKYLSLITDLAMGCRSLSDIQRQRDALTDELGEIYANSPCTTAGAYKKAQKALSLREEMTFSEAEVDAFLPKALRRTGE